jgi:hypothetical protein
MYSVYMCTIHSIMYKYAVQYVYSLHCISPRYMYTVWCLYSVYRLCIVFALRMWTRREGI